MGCLIGMIKTELRDQDGYKLHLRSSSTIDSISWAMSRQTMNSSLISLVPRSFVKGKKGERLCDLNSPPVGEACRNWPPSSSLKWSPLPPSPQSPTTSSPHQLMQQDHFCCKLNLPLLRRSSSSQPKSPTSSRLTWTWCWRRRVRRGRRLRSNCLRRRH